MFKSFFKRSRTQARDVRRLHGRSIPTRRLCLETIEGRLMLSGTSPDVSQLEGQVSLFTLSTAEWNAAFAQSTASTTQSDGGFVVIPSTSFSSSALNDLVSQAVAQSTGSGASLYFELPGGLGIGVRPIMILLPAASYSDSSPHVILIEPIRGTGPTPNSGGTVQIETIISTIESGITSRVNAGVDDPPSAGAIGNSQLATLTVPWTPPDKTVSGEWARGIVLEISGGEPAPGEHSTAADRALPAAQKNSAAANFNPSLSHNAAPGDLTQAIAYRASGRKVSGAPDDRVDWPEIQSSTSLGAASGQIASNFLSGDGVAMPLNLAIGDATFETMWLGERRFSDFNPGSPLCTEATDHEGSGKNQDRAFEGDTWHEASSASALALILVLEQLGTSNFGQSDKENKGVSAFFTWPPRRSSKATNDKQPS
jgi:hypothetical protein